MFIKKGYRFTRNAYYFFKGYDADRFSAPVFRVKSVSDVYKLRQISESSMVNFIIPIEKCVWGAGFRYTTESHPFAQAMDSNNAFYNLQKFYSNYSPDNIFELFFIDNKDVSSLAKSFDVPWKRSSKLKSSGEGGISVHEGVQHYGPCSDRKVRFEADRCVSIYKKIKKEGFWPQRYAGYPRGYFLVSGDEFLFQITGSGQHRTAALAALGWKEVQCTSWKQTVGIIEASNVKKWPGVRDQRVSSEEAMILFKKIFSDELKIQHSKLISSIRK
jgi:hypothetical protein